MIHELSVYSIRNHKIARVQFGGGITVFCGPNGSGKSSLLEATNVLATTHSFRATKLSELIQYGCNEARIEGVVGESRHHLEVRLVPHHRILMKNGKTATNATEFCQNFRVVGLAPEHHAIFYEGPSERRKFLDRLLFSLDAQHLNLYQRYQRALKHKQSLLRKGLSRSEYFEQVEPWNVELIHSGGEIRKRRQDVVRYLQPKMQAFHITIAHLDQGVRVAYTPPELPLEEELREQGTREYFSQRALFGPHKDDLSIELNGIRADRIASQGERASILLALKLAEFELIEQTHNEPPILLLDDLGATLDPERRGKLLRELSARSHQTMVTTSDEMVVKAAMDAGAKLLSPASRGGFSVATPTYA